MVPALFGKAECEITVIGLGVEVPQNDWREKLLKCLDADPYFNRMTQDSQTGLRNLH